MTKAEENRFYRAFRELQGRYAGRKPEEVKTAVLQELLDLHEQMLAGGTDEGVLDQDMAQARTAAARVFPQVFAVAVAEPGKA